MNKKTELAMPVESASLVAGIQAEADEKIKATKAAAEDYSTKRVHAAKTKAEATLAEAREAADARVAAIQAAAESRLAIDRSRSALA
ncbi:MAG: hypothetical protein E4H20_08350, partial [Spirochaetales bacterium]